MVLLVVAYPRRDDTGLGEFGAVVARETPKAEHGLTPWSLWQRLLQHIPLDCWYVRVDYLLWHRLGLPVCVVELGTDSCRIDLESFESFLVEHEAGAVPAVARRNDVVSAQRGCCVVVAEHQRGFMHPSR